MREQLIYENQGLVYGVVQRYEGKGAEKEELFQVGNIGLMKAIDQFDISYNVCFSTYAIPLISGEIKRFFRDNRPVHISRGILSNARLVTHAIEEITKKGESATIEKIQEYTKLKSEDILLAMETKHPMASLSQTVSKEDKGGILLEEVVSSNKNFAEEITDKEVLLSALKQLNKEEYQIILLRYFKEQTQERVAKSMGMNQVKISRMEKKILQKMKNYIEKS